MDGERTGWVLGGRYRVLDRLGSGGMAEVFRAHDDQLDRDVAVKVFRTMVDEPGNATAPERREIELRALAQLSHPNLITLYDANIVDAHPAFLVMELVAGPNLADRLNDGPLPEHVVRLVGAQIADALAYVHTLGMVHRDVKPANILLGTEGPDPETATIRARLSDFGIVRFLDTAHLTADAFTLGTASYLAPEQVRGGDVDAAADVYALGLVLIESLTGHRSFDGPIHEAMAARLARAPVIPPDLPVPWPGLLAAMTRFEPATRPSAADVAAELREPTTTYIPRIPPPPMGAPIPPIPPPDMVPADERRHFPVLLVAALAALAVIGTGLAIFLWPTSAPSTSDGGPTTTQTNTGHATTQAGRSNPHTSRGPGSSSAPSSAPTSSRSSASRTKSTSATTSTSHSSSTPPQTSPARSTSASRSSASSSAAESTSSAPSNEAPQSSTAESGVAVGSASP